MPCYEEDGEFEVEGVVDTVVVDDDSRRKNDPDGDDGSSGGFERRALGGRSGSRRGQSALLSVFGVEQLLVDAVAAG